LRSLLDDRQAPRVVWLAGGAGSGKTRVLRWLESEAVRDGWEVVTRPLTAEPDSGRTADDVSDNLATLRATATHRPTLVLLDEVETADAPVVEFLRHVYQQVGAAPLQVVAGLRPDEARHPALRRMLGETDLMATLARVDLDPLESTSIQRVVARATGGGEATRQQADYLLETTGGSPLLLETLLVEGAWDKRDQVVRHESLEADVAARLNSSSERSRHWLAALCVLEHDRDGRLISEVTSLSREESLEAADEAVLNGLATRGEDGWIPSSRLVSEYVLSQAPSDELRALSERSATAIERAELSRADRTRLARLWRAAGQVGKSIDYAMQAAGEFELNQDFAEAAVWVRFALTQLRRRDPRRLLFRLRHAEVLRLSDQPQPAARALATAVRLSDPSERPTLMAAQALELAVARRFAVARNVAQRTLDTATRDGDRRSLGQAQSVLGLIALREGRGDEAVDLQHKALEDLRVVGDIHDRCKATFFLGLAEIDTRRLSAARQTLKRAYQLAQEIDDGWLQGPILVAIAVVEHRDWQPDDAIRASEAAVAYTEAHCFSRAYISAVDNTGGRDLWLHNRLSRSDALVQLGRPSEAASILTEILEAPLAGFEPTGIDFARITLAEALLETPNPPQDRIKKLLEGLRDKHSGSFKLSYGTRIVELERRALPDCKDPFAPVWEEFLEFAEDERTRLDPVLLTRAHLACARAQIRDGDCSDAERVAATAASIAEDKGLPAFAARAWALIPEAREGQGRSAEAGEALEKGRQFLQEAASRIEDEELRQDFVNRPVFARLREPATPAHSASEDRLMAIYRMIHDLNSETDPDALLESLLDKALEVVGAERGLILLRDSKTEEFYVRLARNLEQETVRDAAEFSRGVVQQAGGGRAVLSIDAGQDERLRDFKSVSVFGIRSVICVPLKSRGKLIGAVYLDNRKQGALFSQDDLRFLEAFADHSALALQNAQIRHSLERENRRLQVAAEQRVQFGNIIGRSAPMQKVFDLIARVAETHLPVLIQGDSGTGKELVARAIHTNGPRSRKPFLTENCAAIPESLLESELFGHVRGAFTGADRDKRGFFEQADGGTLFLDELGDMSPGMQARLLRVVQEGEVRPVGGERTIQVDVRLLTATHRDLQQHVASGDFREDLLYRLQVLLITLPPLRERMGDIPLLVEHMLEKIAQARGRPAPPIRSDVMDLFERYAWPGNVRQLESTLQRLALLAGDGPITRKVVESDAGLRQQLIGETPARPIYSLEQSEREQICAALESTDGNKARAAKLLGISRATIFRKIKEYDLT